MEIVAESLLSLGVEKVCDFLVRESGRIKRVDKQLTELKSELELLRAFLEDADAKKHANETVKSCVEQIKEIVFDTEDIIETFVLRQELSGIKHRIRKLSRNIVDRRKVALEMEGIRKRISKVIENMRGLGVLEMRVNAGEDVKHIEGKQKEILRTFSKESEKNLVGYEESVKKLVSYLVEDDNIQVVSITGMGGLGKTTLARQVFNHEMVKNKFGQVAWVSISQEFSRKYVWQTIFQQLSSKDDEQRDPNMTEDELQDKLFQLLETSNSLIVLDDLWKEEDWDRIKDVFPAKKGWKILLTSRNEKVGLHVDSACEIFKPDYLSTEDSLTLFKMTVFPRKNTMEDDSNSFEMEEKEKMGKEMIEHCGGLPLAVKVLGGLLAKQYTLRQWKRVFQNIKSHIVRNINSFYHILYLSYEELPNYLKHCFLYLAHFPEDFTFSVEKLAYYWAADGIPRSKYYNGATIRDVADEYIGELVQRNMVISQQNELTSRFETCRLHDMMREVCLRKAEDENFLQIVHNTSATNLKLLCKSRRLAVHLYDETKSQVEKIKNPKLRSVLGIPSWFNRTGWVTSVLCFKQVQLMRVLDLSYAKFKGKKIPSSIGKLIHLRYLNLHCVEVSYLPSSMRNLKKLLYLNLVISYSPIYMPNFMKDMRDLACLYLPTVIDDKVKLELGNLVNLETLKNFSTKNSSVKDLHQMTRLEALSILYNGGDCTMETLSSSLSKLTQLENLKVYANTEVAPRNNDEGFVLNARHLRQLILRIYMPKLPDEQNFLSHLTTIDLTNCFLKEDPMPILEKLLQLQKVGLHYKSFCGKRMVCSAGGFPKLQKLNLLKLFEWEEWIVEEGSMPLLQILSIRSCEKLKQLSDVLPVLEKLLQLKSVFFENLSCGRKWVCSAGGFPKLQKLVLKDLKEWEEWIVEEGSMPLLQSLSIRSCEKLKQLSDVLPVLEKLLQLKSAFFENLSCGRKWVCSAGGFPKLQKLELRDLEEWEEWIVEEGSMPLLQSLSIRSCEKLKQLSDVLPVLEKLLELKSVFFENLSCGRKWVCSRGGFPQLKNLKLLRVSDWEEWIVEKDSMPLLHSLKIWDCPKLKQLPDGMRFLTSLKTLTICFVEDLNKEKEWKEILSEGGKDYYKVQHIPLIEIRK